MNEKTLREIRAIVLSMEAALDRPGYDGCDFEALENCYELLGPRIEQLKSNLPNFEAEPEKAATF